VNEVVQLFDDRGIVPFAVEGVNGDDGEQYCGRNLKPMFGDPLHAYQASFARLKQYPGVCSRHSELGEVRHNSTDSVSLTLPAYERGVTMNGNFKLTVPAVVTDQEASRTRTGEEGDFGKAWARVNRPPWGWAAGHR
jgi:hypothetical protein